MKKKYFLILFCLYTLSSCTKFFFANNNSVQHQSMSITYKNCGDFERRNSKLVYFQKKGIIKNIKPVRNNDECIFSFELIPNRNLPLTTILQTYDIEKNPEEIRFICINSSIEETCDTILYRIGNKLIINKFISRSKIFTLLGRTKYVYYFTD